MIDLHFHSSYSDGKLSVPELVGLLKNSGIKVCALTDHDTVAGVLELEQALTGTGIVSIPAVELTALHNDREVHLLAYDFDVAQMREVLDERNHIVARQKQEEMKQAVSLFRRAGIEISSDLQPADKRPVGYTIAVDICSNEKNQEFFVKNYGRRFTRDDVYFEYQVPNKACAVQRSGVTIEWIIHKLQAIAKDLIIAHPFVAPSIVMQPLEEQDIERMLELGITGLEVYHDQTSDSQIQWLEKIVQQKGLNYTGGSDFHKLDDTTPLGHYDKDREVKSFKLLNYHFG